MRGGMTICEAVKALEMARATFDYVEADYFEGHATEAALREADAELKAAERALEAAHLAAGAVMPEAVTQ
jgi:hypothetical protein